MRAAEIERSGVSSPSWTVAELRREASRTPDTAASVPLMMKRKEQVALDGDAGEVGGLLVAADRVEVAAGACPPQEERRARRG